MKSDIIDKFINSYNDSHVKARVNEANQNGYFVISLIKGENGVIDNYNNEVIMALLILVLSSSHIKIVFDLRDLKHINMRGLGCFVALGCCLLKRNGNLILYGLPKSIINNPIIEPHLVNITEDLEYDTKNNTPFIKDKKWRDEILNSTDNDSKLIIQWYKEYKEIINCGKGPWDLANAKLIHECLEEIYSVHKKKI